MDDQITRAEAEKLAETLRTMLPFDGLRVVVCDVGEWAFCAIMCKRFCVGSVHSALEFGEWCEMITSLTREGVRQ